MEDMRALLRSSLGKSLRALSPLDRLAAAWPVACGRAMAAHGTLTSFEEARLTIVVSDAAWLRQMSSLRGTLLAELRRIASVDLREIHFEIAGAARPAADPRAAATPARPGPESTAKPPRTGKLEKA